WNVEPLLHEVKHALDRLVTEGETSVIDLRSIPLAPGEEERILEILGRGEVVARLNVLGASDVVETEYSGVWVVTHYNDNEETIGRFIEVTRLPEILRSQAEDMAEASERLALRLEDEQQEEQTSNKLAVEK
ncbi:hydrogenase expression/formation protein, partial [Solemya elarraichensis gill symbiont]